MRLALKFNIKNPELPRDYRRIFISFIKKSFEKAVPELYEKYYTKGSTLVKPYSFAVMLSKPQFKGKHIELGNNSLTLIFSTGDSFVGLSAYNAFMGMVKKEYPLPNSNTMTLRRVLPQNERMITSNEIFIKLHNPLLIREHNGKKDYYFSVGHDCFAEKWCKNIKYQIELLTSSSITSNELCLQPLESNKVIVEHYGQMLEGSLGIFKLKAPIHILEILYKYGMGSRRSAGFGMFEIII